MTMADIVRGNVEILIRAGAPSRPQDDARHRAMVEAYLRFEPVTRNNVKSLEAPVVGQDEQAESLLRDDVARTIQDERESAQSWRPVEGEDCGASGSYAVDEPASMSFMDSPEMSFRSVLHNNDSPIFYGPQVREQTDSGRRAKTPRFRDMSSMSPKSVISDSQPESSLQLPNLLSRSKALDDYYSRIVDTRDTSQSTSDAGVNGRQPRRSSRISRTSKSNLSFSEVPISSSPVEPPSSPSPNKAFPSKSGRVFRNLNNLPSPPKLVARSNDAEEHSQSDAVSRDLDFFREGVRLPLDSGLGLMPPKSSPLPQSVRNAARRQQVSQSSASYLREGTNPSDLQGLELSRKRTTLAEIAVAHTKRRKLNTSVSGLQHLSDETDPSRSASLPLPPMPPRTNNLEKVTESRSLASSPAPTSPTNVATSSAGSVISAWINTLEINSSPPATSHHSLIPEELVTTQLRRLVTKMSRDNPFTPLTRVRDLRPLERGNWAVNCSSWNDGLRARAWDMLGNFVGKDMAGWAVRCVRSEQHDQIRVFCWGVVVEHVWYLLFLASEGKIKHVEASWIGGDGTSIIVMR